MHADMNVCAPIHKISAFNTFCGTLLWCPDSSPCVIQMWDLDDLLQNSVNAQNDQAAVSDSDSDEMDVDTKPPKSRKGTLDLIAEIWITIFFCLKFAHE